MKNIEKLLQKHDEVVNKLVKKFEKKQDLEFSFWILDEIGGTAVFGDFALNFSDILFDLKTNQPPNRIIKWLDFTLDNDFDISYKNFCKIFDE